MSTSTTNPTTIKTPFEVARNEAMKRVHKDGLAHDMGTLFMIYLAERIDAMPDKDAQARIAVNFMANDAPRRELIVDPVSDQTISYIMMCLSIYTKEAHIFGMLMQAILKSHAQS